MVTYVYECPTHGRREVVKRMVDARRDEHCEGCLRDILVHSGRYREMERISDEDYARTKMRRIFTAPLKQIIRPSGWRLSPDDPKFGDFRREMELGELKDDASPVSMSQAEIDAFDNPPVQIAPDPERDHRLSQLIKQHWTNDLSDDTVRRRELAAIAHKSEEATATCAP